MLKGIQKIVHRCFSSEVKFGWRFLFAWNHVDTSSRCVFPVLKKIYVVYTSKFQPSKSAVFRFSVRPWESIKMSSAHMTSSWEPGIWKKNHGMVDTGRIIQVSKSSKWIVTPRYKPFIGQFMEISWRFTQGKPLKCDNRWWNSFHRHNPSNHSALRPF